MVIIRIVHRIAGVFVLGEEASVVWPISIRWLKLVRGISIVVANDVLAIRHALLLDHDPVELRAIIYQVPPMDQLVQDVASKRPHPARVVGTKTLAVWIPVRNLGNGRKPERDRAKRDQSAIAQLISKVVGVSGT